MMNLKVIRYKNYGCTMTAGPDRDSDWENKFYWSFYELSKGEIISLHYTENWKKNKFVDAEFDYYNTKNELKNGDIISYEFGDTKSDDEYAMSKEFFDWFESLPPYHYIKNSTPITKDEIKCVEAFYDKYINKNEKTDTIYINELYSDFKNEQKKHENK
jgi:hypothetical protein